MEAYILESVIVSFKGEYDQFNKIRRKAIAISKFLRPNLSVAVWLQSRSFSERLQFRSSILSTAVYNLRKTNQILQNLFQLRDFEVRFGTLRLLQSELFSAFDFSLSSHALIRDNLFYQLWTNDSMAIFMAFQSPQLEVLGLTTIFVGLKENVGIEEPSCSTPIGSSNKEKINVKKSEVPKLSVESQQMKRRKRPGAYNLRKRLAWDRAFFTEEGVLNSLELSMLSGSIGNSCREVLPTIHEEGRTLSGNSGSNSDSAVLQGMPKMLSNQRGNRTRPANASTTKSAMKESKIPKIPASRSGAYSLPKSNKNNVLSTSHSKHNQIGQTAKAGSDSSSLSAKSPLQHPRRNMPNSTLEVRSSTYPQPPLVTKANCGLEVFPAAVLPPTGSRAPDACDLYQKTGVAPQNTHYIGGNMRDTQFQTIKPSDNMVGRGGYSEVYRGDLDDGRTIAVKRLTKDNTDENKEKEFLLELEIIGHVNHPNTAILVGCCIENGLHLIFNLSPNGTLASALFDFGLEIIM
ncbi:hypothetical protein ACSBR1_038508 [Camellia fascicularis]